VAAARPDFPSRNLAPQMEPSPSRFQRAQDRHLFKVNKIRRDVRRVWFGEVKNR